MYPSSVPRLFINMKPWANWLAKLRKACTTISSVITAEGVVLVSGTTHMYPRYIYVYTSVPDQCCFYITVPLRSINVPPKGSLVQSRGIVAKAGQRSNSRHMSSSHWGARDIRSWCHVDCSYWTASLLLTALLNSLPLTLPPSGTYV